MSSWYEKHQRRRAAVDANQKAYALNQLDMRHLRDASWESRSSVKITKADIKRRVAKRKEELFLDLQRCAPITCFRVLVVIPYENLNF